MFEQPEPKFIIDSILNDKERWTRYSVYCEVCKKHHVVCLSNMKGVFVPSGEMMNWKRLCDKP